MVSPIVELTCDRVDSITGVPPDTLTVSVSVDTAIWILSVTVCPTVRLSSGIFRAVNPASSVVTS